LKIIRSGLSIPESNLSELDGAPKLSAHDQNLNCDILEILTPFVEATDSVQIDCVPSVKRIKDFSSFKSQGFKIPFCIC